MPMLSFISFVSAVIAAFSLLICFGLLPGYVFSCHFRLAVSYHAAVAWLAAFVFSFLFAAASDCRRHAAR